MITSANLTFWKNVQNYTFLPACVHLKSQYFEHVRNPYFKQMTLGFSTLAHFVSVNPCERHFDAAEEEWKIDLRSLSKAHYIQVDQFTSVRLAAD